MPSYRFPILLWQDAQGGYTACLVEDPEDTASVGPTASAAMGHMKDYLDWCCNSRERYFAEPDFLDPRLQSVKVEVRAEYQVGDRVFPCPETIALKVPAVSGKDQFGMLLCSLPTMGIRFSYQDPAALRGLVAYYVQTKLKGLTPRQISRNLPPADVRLEDIVILVPSSRRKTELDPALKLEALPAVADPVGGREFRVRLARPWQRDAQVSELVEALRTTRASILLVGEGGCGKTAVLAEAVRKFERDPGAQRKEPAESEEGETRESAKAKVRFWLTSASRLIGGMKYLGQWQERCEEIIAELARIDGVLCVEGLLDLVKTGGAGPADSIAAFLAPYLQRRELRVVAEATPAELDACRRLLPAVADLFQVVSIPPMTGPQAIAALEQVAATLGQNLHIDVEQETIPLVHRLFARFMPYHGFPGRCTAFITALFDRAVRRPGAQASSPASNACGAGVPPVSSEAGGTPAPQAARRTTLGPRDVIDRFVQQTGLPELFLRDDLPLSHEFVASALRKSVIGQDSACDAAAALVTTFKAGLNDPGRPVGVLLFCGPTGVGKTELAKAISRFLFGHGQESDRLLRLDMSEYAGPGSAERLLSDAQRQGSDLVKRIRRQPFTVLLLDEIEKAAPEVFDVLLGVFDEGRLTDAYGRLTIFRSAVIIMTFNLGATAPEPFGLGKAQPPAYDSEAMAFFRPEFFNRIDAVLTFQPLSEPMIRAITEKELGEVAQREGLARAGLKLTWTPRLVAHLAQQGFDRRYGARPLQRAIETMLVTPLAKHLVDRPHLRDREIRADLDEAGRVAFGG